MCDSNSNNDFRDAKVGDKVWDVVYGWGEISAIKYHCVHPIEVQFIRGDGFRHTEIYGLTGKNFTLSVPEYPTLFWDEVKIVPPPRPKRKVKKSIRFYLNIYEVGVAAHETPERAKDCVYPDSLGIAVPYTFEYEVEE